jgi:hypothetical protein
MLMIEAIRRLVELGLKVKTKAKPVRKPGRRLRAQELATKTIEKIIDPTAAPQRTNPAPAPAHGGTARIPRRSRRSAEGEEMTKTPGEFEPPKPITKAQREARKAFRQLDTKKAMTDHETAQKAFSANRERLKAERLAREATETPVAAKKAKTKKAK